MNAGAAGLLEESRGVDGGVFLLISRLFYSSKTVKSLSVYSIEGHSSIEEQ